MWKRKKKGLEGLEFKMDPFGWFKIEKKDREQSDIKLSKRETRKIGMKAAYHCKLMDNKVQKALVWLDRANTKLDRIEKLLEKGQMLLPQGVIDAFKKEEMKE